MALSDLIAELYAALPVAYADAPAEEEKDDSSSSDGKDTGPEEEEEEEDEPEDIKPSLEEECAEKQCSSYKHHYDECAARVTAAEESDEGGKGPKEDCVEEFFHLAHCAGQCAAPKLFANLK